MNTQHNIALRFKEAALALALGGGLALSGASAQDPIEVAGDNAISDEVLTTNGGIATLPFNATWATPGSEAGGGNTAESFLVSPAIEVPVTISGNVILKFDHRYFIESGWDGGAVFISVDGAPATYVEGTAFSANGYIGDTTANGGTAWKVNNEDVFYGKSTDYDTEATIESVADLGSFTAGQTISVEFRGIWDEGYTEPGIDWEITTVTLEDTGGAFYSVDFFTDGPSGFTVVNNANAGSPFAYNRPLIVFEIDADNPPLSDRYAPDIAGSQIDLNDSDIVVEVLTGTLAPADSFTLFDLSGGTTLTGSIGNLSLPAGNWDTADLETTGTIEYLGPSAPASQLGVLDLAANGGINPNTGAAWAVGDQYRIAFLTDGTTQTTSNDPNFYRDFVTAEAGANVALQGTYWLPMITLNTSPFFDDPDPAAPLLTVKEFTGTGDTSGGTGVGGAGGPVYVVDGQTCIARNNGDIWNGWSNPFDGDTTLRVPGVHYSPYLTPLGVQPVTPDANHGADVATGCSNNGGTVRPLGTSSDTNPFDINRGSSNANNSGRVWNRFGSSATSNLRLYAISVPLTIIDTNEAVLPTLASSDIVDGQGGADATLNLAPIVYTVTFSEVIDASTLDTGDFGSAGTASFTVDKIRGTLDPAAFEVTVTPTSTGTVQLEVNASAVIEDPAGNALDTTSAITDDTTITVIEDLTAPTVAITDDTSPLPALTNATIVYTVTFDEAMDVGTIDTSDFEAAGTAAGTVESVTYFGDPTVFEVVVSTPATPGDLTLQIAMGAEIKDFVGNLLDTTSAVPDDTTITVNAPAATAASFAVDFQATIASEQHPTYDGEARYYHVSVNPANAGTGSYAATIVGTNDPAPSFVRNYGGDVVSYKFLGGTNNSISGIAAEGGETARITYTTEDWTFDGFGQQQAKIWAATDPGADLAIGGANPYTVSSDTNGGGYRSFGGAVGTIDISGLESGSLHIYYGAFGATPSVRVTMKDTDNIAADLVIANAHLNGDNADRTEYYLAEIDFVTDGFYDLIEYEWLADGNGYDGNGRGIGTVLTGPEPLSDYEVWAEQFAPADLTDPDADLDGDGLTNGAERLFGLDPTDPASNNPITVGLDAGGGTFSFTRRDPALTGKFTGIETSTDLQMWTRDSGAALVVTGPDANGVETVAVTLSGGLLTGPRLFVRVVLDDGILLSENFEDNDGGFTPSGTPNDWASGAPNSDNGFGLVIDSGNGDSSNCWATNLTGPINDAADSILRTPDIDLSAVAGAELTFAAAIDAKDGDTVEVVLRDAGDDSLLATFEPFGANPLAAIVALDWDNYGPFDLAAGVGATVYLEFRFVGTDNTYIGFYLDDVTVSQLAP